MGPGYATPPFHYAIVLLHNRKTLAEGGPHPFNPVLATPAIN